MTETEMTAELNEVLQTEEDVKALCDTIELVCVMHTTLAEIKGVSYDKDALKMLSEKGREIADNSASFVGKTVKETLGEEFAKFLYENNEE